MASRRDKEAIAAVTPAYTQGNSFTGALPSDANTQGGAVSGMVVLKLSERHPARAQRERHRRDGHRLRARTGRDRPAPHRGRWPRRTPSPDALSANFERNTPEPCREALLRCSF